MAARIRDLGRRIELVSMDPHHKGISIGLYETEAEGRFLLHSYSQLDGSADRVARLGAAVITCTGLAPLGDKGRLGFACGARHGTAVRRIFLDAAKRDPKEPLETPAMAIFDKKTERNVAVTGDGKGGYTVTADGPVEDRDKRIGAIAKGLARLAEMEVVSNDTVRFPCGHAHDAMVGSLLYRALNVRAAIREQEELAARGMLTAPSAQSE